jgi:GDP-mannose 6-dehydrogenase
MNISIFGLGYVGCVSTGCLAQNGHSIIGVDVSPHKVDLINAGKPTIVEKDVDKLISENHASGRISATADYMKAVTGTEVSFICVGTPSLSTGQLNLDFVFKTAHQIGEGLKEKSGFHVVVVRSTVFPGTNHKVGEIIGNVSGKTRNVDFAVVSNPEFLREGAAVEDYYNPALTVVGCENEKALEIMQTIYDGINAPFVPTDIQAAEMIKYINNTFHALKITFANEVGNICKSIGIDPFEVMKLFKMDDRLNISPAYFNPGMAYGGSCLPKDLKGLATIAHDNYIKVPVIEAIEHSNDLQKTRVVEIIMKSGKKRVALLGLAFKKGTDDLRYSPSVSLVESILGKGFEIQIYDKSVHLAKLTGANKSYIEQQLPHISSLLKNDFVEMLASAEVLVIAHKPDEDEYSAINSFTGYIIDLVRVDNKKILVQNLEGLSW